jgi:hypothetical protein
MRLRSLYIHMYVSTYLLNFPHFFAFLFLVFLHPAQVQIFAYYVQTRAQSETISFILDNTSLPNGWKPDCDVTFTEFRQISGVRAVDDFVLFRCTAPIMLLLYFSLYTVTVKDNTRTGANILMRRNR